MLTPLLLLGLAIGLIHLPPIQNYLIDEMTGYLTEGTGYRSEIDYANIRWFNSVAIEGTRIYDRTDAKMIAIEELVMSFNLVALIGKKDIRLKEAWVNGASVNLRDEGSVGLNIDDWLIALEKLLAGEATAQPDSTSSTPSESPLFGIDKVTLVDSDFSLSDGRMDSLSTGFDYNHFRLTSLNADLLKLKIIRDTVQLDVKFLSTQDTISGLNIDKLQTFFCISQQGMAFYDLDLQFGQSHLKDSVVFRHEKMADLYEFVSKVDISANLNESVIHTKELSLFAPQLSGYNERLEVSGYFTGKVNDFYSENFAIAMGEHTRLKGDMNIEGLPDIEETIFDIDLKNSTLKSADFKEYIGSTTFGISNKLGLVRVNGDFDGLLNSFVAEGNFKTDIGHLTTNTQINTDARGKASYNGSLQMKNFDLGVFTGNDIFQKIDLNGRIEQGSGFRLEEADFQLDAIISKVGINGYDYENITTDGRFTKSSFVGKMSVNDPNFMLDAIGSIDLTDGKNIIKMDGSLIEAYLKPINLSEKEVFLAADFHVNTEGLALDEIEGNMSLKYAFIRYKNRDLSIESLFFESLREAGSRAVMLNSEYFKMALSGDFQFSTLFNELVNINEQYRYLFSSNMKGLAGFLAENSPTQEDFDIQYQLDLYNVSPVINLFDTTIYIAKDSRLLGSFSNNGQQNLTLNAKLDTVRYANIDFLGNEIDINADNLRDTSAVFMRGHIDSERQRYANASETESLKLEAVWDGKHIDFRQHIGQKSSGNYAEIEADLDFLPERTELHFNKSNILALGDLWQISKENLIIFGKEKIEIQELNLYNENQSIDFNGEISILDDSAKTLQIRFKEMEIASFNPLTDKEYTGKINGTLNAQNLYYNPLFFGNLNILDFRVNNFLVGDVQGALKWEDETRKFGLNFLVNRLGKQIISLRGDFFPSGKAQQLDLKLTLDDANIKIAEPYIEDYFTQLDGTVDGQFTVKGKLRKPVITGQGFVENAGIKINYLNTRYRYQGNFELSKNLISLKNLVFTDTKAKTAVFQGEITHDYFSDFALGLEGDLSQFQVMNLPYSGDALFYGEAYASGKVNLTGAASNLSISAKAATQPGTRVFIPISRGAEAEEAKSFIKYIDRTDTTEVQETVKDEVEKIQIEGLSLDLDVEVTPDAYTEIIINAKTGDIIRGRGNGQLRLQIDSQGEFKMTGGIDILKGAYNFSLYNIITKDFEIEQPSRITWYGNPYEGQMDINGNYRQVTSLSPILANAGLIDNTNTGVARRYPTKVKLNLLGVLLSPQISFDIDFSEINTQEFQLQTAINAFKNKIKNNEQELNRQVLSLIVLNRFSEEGIVNIGGRMAAQNVSQLLSNQFSQLMAQLDENLEVDFDLADLSQEAFNTFQLRLSYTFLGGRLRVTREGGVTNLVDVNSIAGDWTAEYLLTSDGRYKVKVYSRNNFNPARNLINQNNTNTTGASLTQTSNFNSFREFFSGVNRKRKKRKPVRKF